MLAVFLSELVNDVLHIGGPFGGRAALVERLPRNRFADFHDEGLVAVEKHLVDKIEHGDVELDAEELAEVGQPVEAVGVSSSEMDGHDVALRLHALGDEGFRPRDVTYHAIVSARTQSGRKHDDVVFALESFADENGQASALVATDIDGDAERGEAVKVHE